MEINILTERLITTHLIVQSILRGRVIPDHKIILQRVESVSVKDTAFIFLSKLALHVYSAHNSW